MHEDDVRVIETRNEACLLLEPSAELRIRSQGARNHFQRDKALKDGIVRAVNSGGSPSTQFIVDPVTSGEQFCGQIPIPPRAQYTLQPRSRCSPVYFE